MKPWRGLLVSSLFHPSEVIWVLQKTQPRPAHLQTLSVYVNMSHSCITFFYFVSKFQEWNLHTQAHWVWLIICSPCLYFLGEKDEFQHSKTELSRLRRENIILSRRLQGGSREGSVESDVPLNNGFSIASPKLELASGTSGLRSRGAGGSYGGSVLSVTSLDGDGYESVSMSPDIRSMIISIFIM